MAPVRLRLRAKPSICGGVSGELSSSLRDPVLRAQATVMLAELQQR
jgi:hypothetical protein